MNVDNEKIRSIIVKSVLGTLTEEENGYGEMTRIEFFIRNCLLLLS